MAKYLKEQNSQCHVVLADIQGSSLLHKVKHNVLYSKQQQERSQKRHRFDTITEGIGLDRITANFNQALPYIDDALRVSDQEVVDMAKYLLEKDGLFVGSSSAANCVAAVKVAKAMDKHSVVVTVLCGSGQRERTKLHSRDFCETHGLVF